MADATDILLKYMDEQWSQAQQSENQRAATTRYVLLIGVDIQGFIVQRGFDAESVVLAAVLVGLGGYGALLSAKYYERFRLHVSRVGRVMERLEALKAEANMEELERLAGQKHERRHPYMTRVRLHGLWTWLHLGIALVGIINVVIIALKPQGG